MSDQLASWRGRWYLVHRLRHLSSLPGQLACRPGHLGRPSHLLCRLSHLLCRLSRLLNGPGRSLPYRLGRLPFRPEAALLERRWRLHYGPGLFWRIPIVTETRPQLWNCHLTRWELKSEIVKKAFESQLVFRALKICKFSADPDARRGINYYRFLFPYGTVTRDGTWLLMTCMVRSKPK